MLELSAHGNTGLAGADDGDGYVGEGVMVIAIVLGDPVAVELRLWHVRVVNDREGVERNRQSRQAETEMGAHRAHRRFTDERHLECLMRAPKIII